MKFFILIIKSFGIYELKLKGFRSWKCRETSFLSLEVSNIPLKSRSILPRGQNDHITRL